MPWQKASWARWGLTVPMAGWDTRPHDMVTRFMETHPEHRLWHLADREPGEQKPEGALLYYDALRLAEREAGVSNFVFYHGPPIPEFLHEILAEDVQFAQRRAEYMDSRTRNTGTEPPTE